LPNVVFYLPLAGLGGVMVFTDSPLVRSMKFGRVLVIDEIDKAPTEVVCVLKVFAIIIDISLLK
jgi:MoxR-like ATPase